MKSCFKSIFFNLFCPLLLFFHLDKLLRLLTGNKRLIIMYHGVGRQGVRQINGRHLNVEQFERQLIYFKRNFDIVPLRDLCKMKFQGRLPDRHTIALTFDDGYTNNFLNALPLLKKYNIPATFFITTAALEAKDYIHPSDYLDLVNDYLGDSEAVDVNGKKFKKGKYHLIADDRQERSVYEHMNSLGLVEWHKMFSELEQKLPPALVTKGVDEDVYQVLSSIQIEEFVKSDLVTIGSHGHLHINLTALSDEEVEHQLQTSRHAFHKAGHGDLQMLAFPFGRFSDRILTISEKLEFKFLIAAGSVERAQREKVFPRIGILNLGSYAFNILSVSRGFARFGF